jgi:hypothetical protein
MNFNCRYQDYLNGRALEQPEVNHNSVAYILEGGIKNWLATYHDGGEMDLIDFD